MGDVHMHGGVVNTMTVQGDCTQHGGVINRRIQQTGAQATYQQQEPKVVYRDRVVYRDKIKKVKETPEESAEKVFRQAMSQAKYWLQKSEQLEGENERLRQQLADTDRQHLLTEIDNLREKLRKARQRENVAVQQRKDAEREAQVAKSQIWDDFKPTKEMCKQLYKNLKAFLDCEKDD